MFGLSFESVEIAQITPAAQEDKCRLRPVIDRGDAFSGRPLRLTGGRGIVIHNTKEPLPEKKRMKTLPFKLAAAAIALPLLAGCGNVESQGYVENAAPDASHTLDIGGGTLNVVEFTPRTAQDLTCINVSPRSTWEGTVQACVPKASSPVTIDGSRNYVETYKMESNGSTLLVTEFRPLTAPHVVCIHMSPRSTWTGTTMNCTPR